MDSPAPFGSSLICLDYCSTFSCSAAATLSYPQNLNVLTELVGPER